MQRRFHASSSYGRSWRLAVVSSILLFIGEAPVIANTQVQAAEADVTPLVLRDDRFQIDCTATSVQMGADGSLSVDGSSCIDKIQTGAAGTLQFLDNATVTHSCAFGSMTMNANGNMVITAMGNCFGDSDGDSIPDLIDPNVAEAATPECIVQGETPDETVSMTGALYTADDTCYTPAPNRLVAANTVVGQASTPVILDLYAKDSIALLGATVSGNSTLTLQGEDQNQPLVRIWKPFSIEAGSVLRVHPQM